jgi:polyisoprenoid-binding protein YceI
MPAKIRLLSGACAIAVVSVACGTSDAPSTTIETANGAVAPVAASPIAPAFRLVIEQPGNEVRYRVRERLFGKDFDNDAVGVTQAVSGEIAFADDGSVIAEGSKITIDLTGLKSDQERRDRYVQGRILETAKFPAVVFEPTSVRGAPRTLPTSGSTAFSLIGNLTVKGVTRPATWFLSAKFSPTTVTGSASTAFAFADFSIDKPKVQSVLSVADTIKLEYDFSMLVKK